MLRIIQYVTAILFVAAIIIQDIKAYKIKNLSVILCICAGLALSVCMRDMPTILHSFIGIFVPLVLLPLFAVRMLGAGDIKAFCALGALFGTVGIIKIMVLSFLCGGIISLGFMLFRRNGIKRVKRFAGYIRECFMMRKIVSYDGIYENDAVFRFAYAIASGTVLYILFEIIGLVI